MMCEACERWKNQADGNWVSIRECPGLGITEVPEAHQDMKSSGAYVLWLDRPELAKRRIEAHSPIINAFLGAIERGAREMARRLEDQDLKRLDKIKNCNVIYVGESKRQGGILARLRDFPWSHSASYSLLELLYLNLAMKVWYRPDAVEQKVLLSLRHDHNDDEWLPALAGGH